MPCIGRETLMGHVFPIPTSFSHSIRDDDDARQRTTVNAWTNGRDRRETRRLVGRLVGAFVRRLVRA